MSSVSVAYAALTSKMGTLFPLKKRIPFGKDLGRNDSNFLKDSWGLWLTSHNIEELEFCKYSLGYGFTIAFTREVLFLDHDYAKIDAQITAMLEDISTLAKALYNQDQIGAESSIEQIIIEDVSGIEEVFTENSHFISSTIQLRILISENL